MSYQDNCFDTIIIYFLLHELPEEARCRTLAEVMRVLKSGGKLVITEYAEIGDEHYLHKNALFRWVLGKLEPFLPNFWRQNLYTELVSSAHKAGKIVNKFRQHMVFSNFYRVVICELYRK